MDGQTCSFAGCNHSILGPRQAIGVTTLRQPWQELTTIVQRYITCDGHGKTSST